MLYYLPDSNAAPAILIDEKRYHPTVVTNLDICFQDVPWPDNQGEAVQAMLDRSQSSDHAQHSQQSDLPGNERMNVATDSALTRAESGPHEGAKPVVQLKDLQKQLDVLKKNMNKKVVNLWVDLLIAVIVSITIPPDKQSDS